MSILEMVAQQLDAGTISQMGRQVGLGPQETQRAVGAALPVLIGALARNTQSPGGAAALAGALQRDNHASILDNLGGLLGGGGGGGLGDLLGGGGGGGGLGDLIGGALGGALGGGGGFRGTGAGGGLGDIGGAILGHVLGNRQDQASVAVGKAAGIDWGKAAQILAMLAPIVMAVLGKRGQSNGFDIGDLAGMLQGDNQRVQQSNPKAGGMLDSILDRDGDGQVDGEDLAGLGMSVLGGLFGKR
jgi:hypothetical protein